MSNESTPTDSPQNSEGISPEDEARERQCVKPPPKNSSEDWLRGKERQELPTMCLAQPEVPSMLSYRSGQRRRRNSDPILFSSKLFPLEV